MPSESAGGESWSLQLQSQDTPSSAQPTNDGNRESNRKYDIPDIYANLDEIVSPPPVENRQESALYRHKSLEDARNQEQLITRSRSRDRHEGAPPAREEKDIGKALLRFSKTATWLYTISYLILFSFLGTLARLGLQAITFYPGAPVIFSEIWANFGGCIVMGFLSEDQQLFREEWGSPAKSPPQAGEPQEPARDEEAALAAAKKAHAATKKTIPLYIGLATGFCGCFTSFSSFARDAVLALANSLPAPQNYAVAAQPGSGAPPVAPRNFGYSLMALLAVVVSTVSISLSGLFLGAHLAIAAEPFTPSIPFAFSRRFLDRLAVFLAFGCLLGAVILAALPPDRDTAGEEIWRGRAVFALVFAPLGCLGRFFLSLWLNGKIASFPLGTFAANIFGTAVLGMCWDLQHVPLGGEVGCQVLQGIEDGFCGCLTTVSTWVVELSSLKRRNAYRYGGLSVGVALCFLIVIIGSMRWTIGFRELVCTH